MATPCIYMHTEDKRAALLGSKTGVHPGKSSNFRTLTTLFLLGFFWTQQQHYIYAYNSKYLKWNP